MSEELLPCPFCGCEAQPVPEVDEEYQPTGRYSILCMNPDCFTESKYRDTLELAIEKWNRRTEPSIEQVETDMIAIQPDVYLVNWNESQETTYVIAVVKTLEDAHKVIREHVQQLPTYHRRVFYDIEPWDIGEVKSFL